MDAWLQGDEVSQGQVGKKLHMWQAGQKNRPGVHAKERRPNAPSTLPYCPYKNNVKKPQLYLPYILAHVVYFLFVKVFI